MIIYLFQTAVIFALVRWAKSNRLNCQWDMATARRRRSWCVAAIVVVQIAGVISLFNTGDASNAGVGALIQLPCIYCLALALYRLSDLRREPPGLIIESQPSVSSSSVPELPKATPQLPAPPSLAQERESSRVVLWFFVAAIVTCIVIAITAVATNNEQSRRQEPVAQAQLDAFANQLTKESDGPKTSPSLLESLPDHGGFSSQIELEAAVKDFVNRISGNETDMKILTALLEKQRAMQAELDAGKIELAANNKKMAAWQEWYDNERLKHDKLLEDYAHLERLNAELEYQLGLRK